MRNFWGLSRILCIGLSLVLFGCASAEELKTTVSMAGFPDPDDNILLIVGEGGPSGGLFIKAAETYRREHGGVIYPVDGGDSFVDAMEDFVAKYGAIDHLEYFGHGNSVGLYVNQAPNVNGGLYANDPQLDENYLAASIYQLPADIFSARGDIRFNGCNVAEGFPELPTLAQSFANYFGVKVEAPRGPTEFSKTPDLVDPIPDSKYLGSDFAGPVYMVSTYVDKSFVEVFP